MRDALDGAPPPYYLVFVGGPDRIPFDVQFLYDRDSATGRIDPGFDLDGAPPRAPSTRTGAARPPSSTS